MKTLCCHWPPHTPSYPISFFLTVLKGLFMIFFYPFMLMLEDISGDPEKNCFFPTYCVPSLDLVIDCEI